MFYSLKTKTKTYFWADVEGVSKAKHTSEGYFLSNREKQRNSYMPP